MSNSKEGKQSDSKMDKAYYHSKNNSIKTKDLIKVIVNNSKKESSANLMSKDQT